MKIKEKNIVIAGVGGQGNILASKIIAEAALIQGLNVILGEVYGSSQRGGSVMSHIRLGDGVLSPLSPEHEAEVICGLEPMETLRVAKLYANPNSLVITNTRTIQPMAVNTGKLKYPSVKQILEALENLCKRVVAIDATTLAEQAGGAVSTNMVLLGVLSTVKTLGVSVKSYEGAISRIVPKSVEMNLKAFHLGQQACLAKKSKNKP